MKKYTRENKKIMKLLGKGNFSEEEMWDMVNTAIASTSQTAKHFCRLYEGYNSLSNHAYDQKDRLLKAIGYDVDNSWNCQTCPDMFVRTNTWEGLTTDFMEMSMQDVSGWKHPKSCTWASYMAGWRTVYGVYLSPVEVPSMTAPEDSCLIVAGNGTARMDVGDTFLFNSFGIDKEDGSIENVPILDAKNVRWGSRRKVRLSDKVIEDIIEVAKDYFGYFNN